MKNVRQTVHTYAENTATRHPNSPGVSRLLIEQSVRKIAQNTQRTIRKKSIPESKEKVLKPCGFRTFVAAGEGFEPSHTESESAVLPLHKPAIFARSCRTNRYYYTGKQEFVKGVFEKNNICRFQPFSGHFPRKTPAPRASSEADLVIPQVRSGAESAFSLNFIRHQCPAPPCSM